MQIQRRISKKKKRALVGQEFGLLLEGVSEESELLLEGRTAMHAPEIDGKVFVNDVPEGLRPVPGEFYRCQITEAHGLPASCRENHLKIYASKAYVKAALPDLQETG